MSYCIVLTVYTVIQYSRGDTFPIFTELDLLAYRNPVDAVLRYTQGTHLGIKFFYFLLFAIYRILGTRLYVKITSFRWACTVYSEPSRTAWSTFHRTAPEKSFTSLDADALSLIHNYFAPSTSKSTTRQQFNCYPSCQVTKGKTGHCIVCTLSHAHPSLLPD